VGGVGYLPAAGVVLHDNAALPALQVAVESQFNPVQPLAVDAGKPKNMGRQRVVGIVAAALLGDPYPRQTELLHRQRRRLIHFSFEPGERLASF
jgi:hypothetical protein